jgi:DNA-binding transcriptional MerR regulator
MADVAAKPRTYTITELTRELGVSTRTLRFYEDEGMLHPLRDGRHRFYRPADRVRLKLILRGKRLGFSLAEIREMIGMYDAEPGEAGQLTHLIGKIGERRTELQQKQLDIATTLDELASVEEKCRARLAEIEAGR